MKLFARVRAFKPIELLIELSIASEAFLSATLVDVVVFRKLVKLASVFLDEVDVSDVTTALYIFVEGIVPVLMAVKTWTEFESASLKLPLFASSMAS
jgi:hypothetical protein